MRGNLVPHRRRALQALQSLPRPPLDRFWVIGRLLHGVPAIDLCKHVVCVHIGRHHVDDRSFDVLADEPRLEVSPGHVVLLEGDRLERGVRERPTLLMRVRNARVRQRKQRMTIPFLAGFCQRLVPARVSRVAHNRSAQGSLTLIAHTNRVGDLVPDDVSRHFLTTHTRRRHTHLRLPRLPHNRNATYPPTSTQQWVPGCNRPRDRARRRARHQGKTRSDRNIDQS